MVAKKTQEPTSQPTAAQDIYTLPDKDPRFPFSLMRFRIVCGIFHDPRSRITPRRFCWSCCCCCCGGGCKLGLKLRGGGWVGEKLTKTVGWRILMILMNCVCGFCCVVASLPAQKETETKSNHPPHPFYVSSPYSVLLLITPILSIYPSIHEPIQSPSWCKQYTYMGMYIYPCCCVFDLFSCKPRLVLCLLLGGSCKCRPQLQVSIGTSVGRKV